MRFVFFFVQRLLSFSDLPFLLPISEVSLVVFLVSSLPLLLLLLPLPTVVLLPAPLPLLSTARLVPTGLAGLGDNPRPPRLQPPLELLVPGGELHLLQPSVAELSPIVLVAGGQVGLDCQLVLHFGLL